MKLSRAQVMTIFDVQRFSLHDGPGIRTTVFFKGCPLRCLWCQNPEGLEFGIDNVKSSKNAKKYRCITPEVLAEEVQADSVFFEVSGGGVTFSGGEALAQIDDVCTVAGILRTKKIHTAVETSLYAPTESIQKAVDSIDLILADIKIFDTEKHKAAIGADNELIRENFKYIAEKLKGTGRLIARTPLIPGYTADKKNIAEIGAFIGSIDPSIQWELLNFNPLASAKYDELHNDGFKIFEGIKPFSDMEMDEFKKIAVLCGVDVI